MQVRLYVSGTNGAVALLLSEKGAICGERRCSSMVLSRPGAAFGPAGSRSRDDTRESQETTMAIVQRDVQIKSSPQETMALLSDASRWPDWYPGMTEINITAPFPEEGGKV